MTKNFVKAKCFIKVNGEYQEISYEELLRRCNKYGEYKLRKFIPLHGMLMEVTPDEYKDFYKKKNRQLYLTKRSALYNDLSIDMLTTDDFNGEDILVDTHDVAMLIEDKIMVDKLHRCLLFLKIHERELIDALFYRGLSEREWSIETGIPQKTINDRKSRILTKLKKYLEMKK